MFIPRLLIAPILAALACATTTIPTTADRPAALSPAVVKYSWPLASPVKVARPFQAPASRWGPGHRGVDLASSPGADVLAAGDGLVTFAGVVVDRPVLTIQHANGLRTTYEPVTATVQVGQQVRRTQPIGRLEPGHPGCPATACLHWGALRPTSNGDPHYVDPTFLLHQARVRLLP